MNKLFLYIIIFIGLVLLPRCNNSVKTENGVTDTKPLNTGLNAKDTTAKGTEASMRSEITCPKCGHKKMEIMPTEVCLIKYTCEKCSTTLYPKDEDCCVFCSYGTHKCPSMQDN